MLQQREMIAELMDAPDLDAKAHDEALAGLRRLNKASKAALRIAEPILRWRAQNGKNQLDMLDVACGGGDVPVQVVQQLKPTGVAVSLTLNDRSTTALDLARQAAQAAHLKAHIICGEVPDGLPNGEFDVITNSLFLHHLTREQAVATLREIHHRLRKGGILVISDLRRSVVGWGVAWLMCRLLSRSRIVHFDGPVSVRAAWTPQELRTMAIEAGITEANVNRCWPWRMLLVWEKK